jgi:hypothetical protein
MEYPEVHALHKGHLVHQFLEVRMEDLKVMEVHMEDLEAHTAHQFSAVRMEAVHMLQAKKHETHNIILIFSAAFFTFNFINKTNIQPFCS